VAFKYLLEVLTIIAVVGFCGFFLYTSSQGGGAFEGTDVLAQTAIAQLTGKAAESFAPLIPQWVPPSGEIESALFALQAAIGGILVGWVFGYWRGQRKEPAVQPEAAQQTI
jgi:cobalt/nickel transport protein